MDSSDQVTLDNFKAIRCTTYGLLWAGGVQNHLDHITVVGRDNGVPNIKIDNAGYRLGTVYSVNSLSPDLIQASKD